jgi:hypothetical protein
MEYNASLNNMFDIFVDATALLFAAFGQGTGPIHIDDVQCRGFEDALLNCTYDSNTADCIHVEDASVRCQRKQGVCSRNHYT